MQKLLLIALLFIFGGLLMVGCMTVLQERLLFFPEPLAPDQELTWTGAEEEVFLDTEDGARIHGLFFRAPQSPPRAVILYFHGNAGNVASWAPVARDLLDHGVDVFLVDYRTYGKSTGKMSEEGLYQDGAASYRHLLERGYNAEEIIVYGRSLGASVATYVAKNFPVQALVLETPFSSLTRLAGELYPFFFPRLFLRYELDNEARAAQIDAPTLIVHGTQDEIIPLEHAERVFQALPAGYRLVVIDGGAHNDLSNFPEHRQALADFFEHLNR